MALQWMILTYVVAAEAALALLLTFPSPKLLKNRFVSLISLILQPTLFIIPFAGFQLLDIYWKNEHRLMCTSEICTAAERDRYEKSLLLKWGIGANSIIFIILGLGVQSSKECNFVYDCMPPLLVYLPDLQVSQGNSEFGGSREEIQE
ncbi:hypothetical protein GOBAR_AA29205 [Gossypium barbadense]|uniref:Endoplasmic reticulum transmembrane protein n=2 Tax=Gossypium TaxID=3633 RepID=A0ABR0QK51_GOSAR|nr:hypothetical protein PVK06_008435 [Gossypium arboreum]PPR91480.1 hypothetical protein GOBAR_AA29205 [Gossypium barbadense]